MKLFLVLFSILVSMSLISQSEEAFLNKYLEECSKKEAIYKRSYKEIGNGLFLAEIKYFSGNLKAEGTYLFLEDEMVPHGNFVFFYENGEKESEGKFVEGYKVGEWKRYMRDGTELRPKYYQPTLGSTIDALIRN